MRKRDSVSPGPRMRSRDTVSPSRRRLEALMAGTSRPASGLELLRRPELQALAKSLNVNARQTDEELIKSCKGKSANLMTSERECVRLAFASIDSNHDGVLSGTEVTKALRTQPSVRRLISLPAILRQEEEIHEAIERVCAVLNGGEVTLPEFEDAFCRNGRLTVAQHAAQNAGSWRLRPLALLALVLSLITLVCGTGVAMFLDAGSVVRAAAPPAPPPSRFGRAFGLFGRHARERVAIAAPKAAPNAVDNVDGEATARKKRAQTEKEAAAAARAEAAKRKQAEAEKMAAAKAHKATAKKKAEAERAADAAAVKRAEAEKAVDTKAARPAAEKDDTVVHDRVERCVKACKNLATRRRTRN
jgi:hypothetical protein